MGGETAALAALERPRQFWGSYARPEASKAGSTMRRDRLASQVKPKPGGKLAGTAATGTDSPLLVGSIAVVQHRLSNERVYESKAEE